MKQDCRVLITGSGGQLGHALTRSAPKQAVTLSLTRGQCDVSDAAAVSDVFRSFKPTAIINAAAYTDVDKAEADSDRAFAVNALGPENLARVSAKHGARFVHVSTDYVFDGFSSSPYPTDASPAPRSVYGASKLAGEVAVSRSGADAVVVRTAWLYSSTGKNFLTTILREIRAGRPLRVIVDRVGTPTSVTQLAPVLWWCASTPTLSGIQHWTNAGVASWYDFAVAIHELALDQTLVKSPVEILPIRAHEYPTPATRPMYSVLDCGVLWSAYGVAAHWRAALKEAIARVLPE